MAERDTRLLLYQIEEGLRGRFRGRGFYASNPYEAVWFGPWRKAVFSAWQDVQKHADERKRQ